MPLPAPASTPVAALKLSTQPETQLCSGGQPETPLSLLTWYGIPPGGRHNAGPDDGDGEPGTLALQDVLRQSFSEGVGVGLGANHHRRDLGTVQLLRLDHLNYFKIFLSQLSLSLSLSLTLQISMMPLGLTGAG